MNRIERHLGKLEGVEAAGCGAKLIVEAAGARTMDAHPPTRGFGVQTCCDLMCAGSPRPTS